MRLNPFFIFAFSCLLLIATNVNADSISLDGAWQFQPTVLAKVTPDSVPAEDSWQTINVPDNWFRQGYDVSGKAWYRKQFIVKPEMLKRHVRIVFDGVDYMADVWLNGHYLGHHEGYFQSFDFDVSRHLQQGNNELTVLVDSPLEDIKAWSFHKRLLKGIFSHHDTRPGGAWSERGQDQNTGGIWAPVRLETSDQLAIRVLTVSPKLIEAETDKKAWRLETNASVGSELAQGSEVAITATVTPENFKGKSYKFSHKTTLDHGDGKLAFSMPIEQPTLWWPTGHGKPNLYRLKLAFVKYALIIQASNGSSMAAGCFCAVPTTFPVNG